MNSIINKNMKFLPLMLEEPLASLQNKTNSSFGSGRVSRAGRVRINKVEAIVAPQSEMLQFNFETVTSGSSNVYDTTIVFENIKYLSEASSTSVQVEAVDGKTYHIEPLSYSNMNSKVRCTCLDFYWRFATWNKQQDSLHGEPPTPYVPISGRPLVNPKKTSGMCKHIMICIGRLTSLNILK